jgi:hypothetical protein
MAKRTAEAPDTVVILRAACSMIENHGARAIEVARQRAKNLGGSASEARQTWERIVAAIEGMKASAFRAAA